MSNRIENAVCRHKIQELILKLKEKTGRGVVVLVDEYDKPVIDFIGKGEEALEIAAENTDKVFIIEFKCNQNAGRVIRQIRQKGYAEKYRGKGVKVILMGIDFSSEERNIREWKIEELNLQPSRVGKIMI